MQPTVFMFITGCVVISSNLETFIVDVVIRTETVLGTCTILYRSI